MGKNFFEVGNKFFIEGDYKSALESYKQGSDEYPDLKFFYKTNIQICQAKLQGLPIKFDQQNLDSDKTVYSSKAIVNFDVNDNWYTTEIDSITTSLEIELPKRVYIAPAILRPRNTTRYRAFHLEEQLKDILFVEIINFNDLHMDFYEGLTDKDTVIIQRIAFDKKSEVFLNALRNTPATIVYDIDDQVFDENEIEDWRSKSLPHHPLSYRKAMRYADQFTVSTKQLRAKIELLFKKPVHVLPNLLSSELLISSNVALGNVTKNDNFVIGYASGSSTHDKDLQVALPGISKFLKEHKNAIFLCIGFVNLPNDFVSRHKSQIVLHDPVSWNDLPHEIAKFDIQIIPLDNSKFNSYKSQIRFLESSAVKVPVLASNNGEQALNIVNYETGIVCSNKKSSWYEGLCWYYNNPDERHRIAENANNNINQYWTTQSSFRKYKLSEILKDFSINRIRDKVSIILVVYNPIYDIEAVCNSIIQTTNVPFELIIWINSQDKQTIDYINNLEIDNKYIMNFGKNVGKAVAANYMFDKATERFVCGLDDDYILPEYWAEKMISTTKIVPNLGWLSSNLTKDSSGIRGLGKSTSYSNGSAVYMPSGVGGWMVFTTASQREKIGYYVEHGLYGGVDGDYNRRARSMKLVTGYVRDVVGEHKVQRSLKPAWELFKQRIQDNMREHGKQSDNVQEKFVDFFKNRPDELTCSIKISTSKMHDENVWGDTHYANGLKKSLEKNNYIVRVDKHEDWYSNNEKMDVVIHLFGLHDYNPDDYSLNIIWIISHVDKISRKQLLKYDYIFSASKEVDKKVKKLVPEIKSSVLYQCTDSAVFNKEEDIEKDIDLLFVGNSRRVFRESVKFAVELGYDIHVWGTKWEQFIPKQYIKGQSIASAEVAKLYQRAKIVLNDHWSDQIEFKLVNNRVFDVLACGSLVISDHNDGVTDIFENSAIPMYRNKADFKNKVDQYINNEQERLNVVNTLSKNIRDEHTFDNRVNEINRVVLDLISTYVEYKSEYLYEVRAT